TSHKVIKMAHNKDIVNSTSKVFGISGNGPQAHGKSGGQVLHIVSIPFGHIQLLTMVQFGFKTFGVIKGWPFLQIRIGKINVFPCDQRMRDFIEIIILLLVKQDTEFFSLKMEMENICQINIVMHKRMRIGASKEQHG